MNKVLMNNPHTDIYCGSNPLTNMTVDKDNKRAFISNKNGHLFIFDISSVNY